MRNTLPWRIRGKSFEDGSNIADWRKIDTSPWQWQYDTHELGFNIYEHAGEFWKLYRIRFVPQDATEYQYDFGGQACRMALVEYKSRTRSPHSSRLMDDGDLEWVRTYEVDETIHTVIRSGQANKKSEREEISS